MVPRRGSDGSIQYDVCVPSCDGPHVYRTTDILYDGGFGTLAGRGTRVWKARRLDAAGEMTGEPVALKDAWVDRHREREGDISARIRQSSSVLEPEDHELLNNMLLTVLDHGDVYISGLPDRTRLLPTVVPQNEFSGQVHYRIVCAEVGIPLREETSLHAVYQALVDVCGGASPCVWYHTTA